jgi:predicted Zn finger-like uncharacterized protein
MIDLKKISENLSDEENAELLVYRGGCSCHRSPPCSAHSDPLTMTEAIVLGFVEVEDQSDSTYVICPYCQHRYYAEAEDTDESERDVECDKCGNTFVLCEVISIDHCTRAKEEDSDG